jgi:RNA polymerase sigma-70 factor (ECF subfamily)
LDAESWDRLPDRFGFDPAQESGWRDLFAALRRAVDTELTPASARSSSRSPSTMSRLMPWR